jgi:hypothetical protein
MDNVSMTWSEIVRRLTQNVLDDAARERIETASRTWRAQLDALAERVRTRGPRHTIDDIADAVRRLRQRRN